MNEFDIIIPEESKLIIDVTDVSLYDYNFEAFSLNKLQETANDQVNRTIFKKLTNMIVENTSTFGELKIFLIVKRWSMLQIYLKLLKKN